MGNQPSELSQASEDQTRQRSIQKIDSQVSQKFGKTTNWHLKVVIRGDKGTGKSSLFQRLQGKPFSADYTPTETLQSAKVSWNYRTSHDIVNLEVWDVVDAPKIKKTNSSGLKLATGVNGGNFDEDNGNYDGEPGTSPYDEVDLDTVPVAGKTMSPTGKSTLGNLDSSSVDVLRGTHAVVLVFNPLKKWTWEYAKREISKIPHRIQVLLMANFKDQCSPSTTTTTSQSSTSTSSAMVAKIEAEDIRTYIELLDRPVYFLEASMQNCYGLKGLKTFLNLPFLLLQREVIETQLQQNQRELETAEQEYRLTADSDSYDAYLQMLSARASAKPPLQASTESATSAPTKGETSSTSSKPSTSAASSPAVSKATSSTSSRSNANSTPATPTQTVKKAEEPKKKEMPKSKPVEEEESGGFMSRFFGKKNEKEMKPTAEDKKAVEELKRLKEGGASAGATGDVDDFVPDSAGGWLDDEDDTPVVAKIAPAKAKSEPKKTAPTKPVPADDSDDDDRPNPAIADYSDELDDTDQLMMEALAKAKAEKAAKAAAAKKSTAKPIIAAPVSNDSDDDEDDDANPALASYEEELDFEDAQIKGKPAPKPVAPVVAAPAKTATPPPKVTARASSMDSDDDDDNPNPALTGYSEDIDFDDIMTSPSASSGSIKGGSLVNSGTATPTHLGNSTTMPKLTAPVLAAHTPAPSAVSSSPVSTPHSGSKPSPTTSSSTAKAGTAVKPKSRVVESSDSDSDAENNLVAKDESDSDEDFAGFVPKKTSSASSSAMGSSIAKSASSSMSDLGSIPDFNPMDAHSEAESDAFWANARAPPVRKPSTPVVAPAPADPFAFGSTSSTPISSTSTSHKERKDKDKHKHKHHKDKKDKKDKHRTADSNSSSPAPQYFAGPASHQMTQQPMQYAPPVASTPPPSAAPKKSVFYL